MKSKQRLPVREFVAFWTERDSTELINSDDDTDRESTNQFTHCCGAGELGGFVDMAAVENAYQVFLNDELDQSESLGDPKPDWVQHPNRTQLTELYAAFLKAASPHAITVATTIPNQRMAILALRKAGFRAVGSARNGGTHGNMITLWTKFGRA